MENKEKDSDAEMIQEVSFDEIDDTQSLVDDNNPLFPVETESQQIITQAATPMAMLNTAIQRGAPIEMIKELMALRKEFEADEARKAFYDALSKFKANPPRVVKDLINTQYGSDYTSIGNMVNTVNRAMGKFGLSTSWEYPESDKAEWMIVTCVLSHQLGHQISVTLEGPIDTSGKKNPLQERKSTRTYLKLETFEAVTGMASVSGNYNDDGNASGQNSIERITTEQVKNIESLITEVGGNKAKFLKWCKLGSIEEITPDEYSKVISQLEKKRK